MRIEQLTCAIGAELLDVDLGDAVRDDGLFNEIYTALLKYKVLFLRDQDLDKFSRQDHDGVRATPRPARNSSDGAQPPGCPWPDANLQDPRQPARPL